MDSLLPFLSGIKEKGGAECGAEEREKDQFRAKSSRLLVMCIWRQDSEAREAGGRNSKIVLFPYCP